MHLEYQGQNGSEELVVVEFLRESRLLSNDRARLFIPSLLIDKVLWPQIAILLPAADRTGRIADMHSNGLADTRANPTMIRYSSTQPKSSRGAEAITSVSGCIARN